MWLSCQRLHVHSALHVYKCSGSIVPAIHRAQRTIVRKKAREFLMEYTYSDSSPWTNVALAVVQQSDIAKLASPRKNRTQSRNGVSPKRISPHVPPKVEAKGKRVLTDWPRSQANFHTGLFKRPTLLSPAADPLSSDARSPSQLRRMCSGGNARSRDADVKAAWPCATQHRECGEGVGGTRAADGRGRTRISGCWVDAGGHDRGVRRWGVGCRRPEAE